MEKVIQELAVMYREAGVPLATVHLGGDEVARGVWLGSPKCRALMKEKGMTKPHDLAEHFITRMADIMQRNGLKFSGWQEALWDIPKRRTGNCGLRRQACTAGIRFRDTMRWCIRLPITATRDSL